MHSRHGDGNYLQDQRSTTISLLRVKAFFSIAWESRGAADHFLTRRSSVELNKTRQKLEEDQLLATLGCAREAPALWKRERLFCLMPMGR